MLRSAGQPRALLRALWRNSNTSSRNAFNYRPIFCPAQNSRKFYAATQFPDLTASSWSSPNNTANFCSSSTGERPQDSEKRIWPPSRDELKIVPLPDGITNERFAMYELGNTANTGVNQEGLSSILGVHGPPELWSRGDHVLEGAFGGIFAVIAAGGTQFKLCEDNVFYINRVPGEVNEEILFDKVLLLGTVEWSVFGRPYIPTATVVGTIEEQTLSGKVEIVKFKKRKGYTRRKGHRQKITRIRVNEIRFTFPESKLITPYEVEFDPMRPPTPNHPRYF